MGVRQLVPVRRPVHYGGSAMEREGRHQVENSPCLTYNLASPSWGLHLMRDIHDRLDLHDLRTVGGGFIVYALSKDVTLHRAQCCEIDPLYSTPSGMKFFETHSEAGQW